MTRVYLETCQHLFSENGDVWSWGRGEWGQLGLGKATQRDKDIVTARKVG